MKNYKLVLVLLLIVSIVAFAGCKAQVTENETVDGDGYSDAPITTTIVHGNPSGVWFMLSTAIAESLGNTYSGSIMHATPGYTNANIFRMEKYETEFAMTHSNLLFEAVNGFGQFEEKLENIGAIAIFYPSVFQFAVKEKLGLTSFDQFIENKIPVEISIGATGGNSQLAFIALLSEYGLTLEDLEAWGCKLHKKGLKDSAELFSDGIIDGILVAASAPTPTIMQMGTNTEMVMLPMNSEMVDIMAEKYGYVKYNIPAGSYGFITEEVTSFTTFSMLAASLQTSEEAAYKVTKSINENLDYIQTIHSALSGLTTEKLVANMSMPLHPGAEKYYREIGAIK